MVLDACSDLVLEDSSNFLSNITCGPVSASTVVASQAKIKVPTLGLHNAHGRAINLSKLQEDKVSVEGRVSGLLQTGGIGLNSGVCRRGGCTGASVIQSHRHG